MLSIPLSIIIPMESSPMIAAAVENEIDKKPFAPLDNLLPAIRVKLSIDTAIDLTKSLIPTSEGSEGVSIDSRESTIAELEKIILGPQNYVQPSLQLQGVPAKPADLYLQSYRTLKGDLPFQKALVQSGDVDAWKRLKRREKKLEQSSSVRAALNAYTDALSFSGDSYLLRVDAKTKSSMVREDRLPDIKQVITSDMGMRYLYRNQVLTAMDDVKFELVYQLNQRSDVSSSIDGRELLDLLRSAQDAMDRWLSLVPSDDVSEALNTVNRYNP